MWEKLREIARRYDEIGELLEIPEIYGDPEQLRRLTREQKELEPVTTAYRSYLRCAATAAESEELLADPELHDMAQEELRLAKAEKERGKALCESLQQRFEAEFGTLLCADILREHDHDLCDRCIGFAAERAEEIIRDNKR